MSGGTNFTIEHEQVLRIDPNNSEISYKKFMYFSDRGAYALYAPCMSTPLLSTSTNCALRKRK